MKAQKWMGVAALGVAGLGGLGLAFSGNSDADQLAETHAAVVAAIEADDRTYNFRELYEANFELLGADGLIAAVEEARPYCHDEGHDLGKVIFAHSDGDVGGALMACGDACNSGCMHGVLMGFFGEAERSEKNPEGHVSLEEVRAKIDTVCTDPTMTSLYPRGDCLHGVGHALMFLADYDVDAAMTSCDLFQTEPERYYCATGAYMEYVIVKDKVDATLGTPLFYPCEGGKYPAACFRYKTLQVLKRHYQSGGELSEIVAMCEAMDGFDRLGCFHGVGNAHLAPIVVHQTTLGEVCDDGTEADQSMCIEGSIERMAKYHPEEADAQCALLSGWKADVCQAGADRAMYDLEKSFEHYF
jgi:hypothetical protein